MFSRGGGLPSAEGGHVAASHNPPPRAPPFTLSPFFSLVALFLSRSLSLSLSFSLALPFLSLALSLSLACSLAYAPRDLAISSRSLAVTCVSSLSLHLSVSLVRSCTLSQSPGR
mmetsp:Transcript_5305/g.12306  ORF Transcript_5305/g.12306 Transcript_5305/m.12306 type:complete len:114 (-) Transcript_5305:16-357(-)